MFSLRPRLRSDSEKTPGSTATRGSSHTVGPLPLPNFLCSFYVQQRVRDRKDKDGNTIELDPPQKEQHLEQVIVRNDGKIYSNAPIPGTEPLSKLPVEFHGHEIPPEYLRWSGAGVNRFRDGERPDAFSALCAVVRHYMDLSGSFTTEDKLQELTAIWALNTYLLGAYPAVGYLWPNGEGGSGKSHLLYTLSAVSYLGFVSLASGSFASIRDLAGYGATLLFDDAEKIMDPKSGDPDKQALLLAGNRKGTTVPIKVADPANPKKWITRHINAYCPRAFSAIGLPIDTMASRTIFVPLLASANSGKANSDPLDFDAWPQGIDRRRLVDDLWALALRFLILQPVEHAIRGLAFLGEVSCASLNGSARWNATGARRIAFDAFPPLFRCIFPAAGAAEMKLQVTSARSKTRSIRSGLRCWANGK